MAKGGDYRKWYGNLEYLVNWNNSGKEIKDFVTNKYPYLKGNYSFVVKNESKYFIEGIICSKITSGGLSFRKKEATTIFADACTGFFPENISYNLALVNSKIITLVTSLNKFESLEN